MKAAELRARLFVGAALTVALGLPFMLWARTPLIHARMAEAGGWSPTVLQARVGEPLHLRLTSDDVTHGFAVGQMPMQSLDVLPGKVTDTTLTFDRPGTYTFYCTRWCGANHWRMRGTIEVTGGSPSPVSVVSPLYVSLGLNLDAPHIAPIVPAGRPIASIVHRQFAAALSAYGATDYYRTHSPYQTWTDLRRNVALGASSDQDLWNLTASIWRSNTTPQALEAGRKLFGQNCAACHGEQGRGDGVFSAAIAAENAQTMSIDGSMPPQGPANFTDGARLLGASPALLQGKILRGGMGTGMPSWGPIFTPAQTWDLVAYLYSFQFGYDQ